MNEYISLGEMTRVANLSSGKMFTSDYDVVANHHYRQMELLVAVC